MNAQNNNNTNEWREAFAEAQMTPDARVWNNIELELARNANGNYKKRILFLKLLAAASISLAAIIGGGVVFKQFYQSKSDSTVASQSIEAETLTREGEIQPTDELSSKASGSDQLNESASASPSNDSNAASTNISSINGNENVIHNSKVNDESNQLTLVVIKDQNKSQSVVSAQEPERNSISNLASYNNPDVLDKIGAETSYNISLPDRELNMVPRLDLLHAANGKTDKLWLGVNFAMGSNSPAGGASQEQAQTLALNDANGALTVADATVSEEQQGSVVVAGLGIGKQLGERWILESGLAYAKRNTFVESNLAVASNGRVEALNSFDEASAEGSLIFTDSYELRNTYNSISVPLQAGYLVVDGTLDLYMKAGIVNEFLLWNEVEDTDGNYNNVTVSAGSDSPYNIYILNGTVGSELRYQVGENYHISLVPQVQKSLNSFLKSDDNNSNRPLLLTVGLRFKYQFD